MSIDRKLLIAGAAAAALTAATAYALADPGHGRGGMGHGMGMGSGMGPGMKGGQHGGGMGWQDPTERLAAAKTAIGIKPEQTAAWETYAKVVTGIAADRRSVHENMDREAVHAMKPGDRQAFRDAMMQQRDDARAKIKAAAETLLAQLDDAQKSKARDSLPGLIEHAPGQGMRHGISNGAKHGHGGHGTAGGGGMGPRRQH